jgi:hypothetical protein
MALAPTSASANKARRMVQYDVAKVNLPPIPSALTLAGPIDKTKLSFPNSAGFKIDGHNGTDPVSGASCGPDKPAIGTVTDVGTATETATQVAQDGKNTIVDPTNNMLPKPANYIGADNCGSTGDVQNVINDVNSEFSTVSGLNTVVHDISNAATHTYKDGATIPTADMGLPIPPSTTPNPQVLVVDGSTTLSGNPTGYGILLVTGTLTLSGDFKWTGLVLVIGDGNIQMGGGGNAQITGALVVANIAGNSSYATNPTTANLAAQLGSPTMQWAGGGGNGIKYDSCDLNLAVTASNFTVIARREITY